MRHWILDENRIPRKADLLTWAVWFEKDENRIVRSEWIGDTFVSTIFLGLDHNFSSKGPPILWETMAFGNRKNANNIQERCAGSWEQAEAMHEVVVMEVCKIEKVNYQPLEQRTK